MNFEQQIAEAKRNIAKFKTWARGKVILAVSAGVIVGLFLLISNVSARSDRNELAEKLQTTEAEAGQRIEYLSSQLEWAKAELVKSQNQAELLASQNIELRELAHKAASLVEDLTATYAELDQAQAKIKSLIAEHDALERSQAAETAFAQTNQ